MGTLATLYRRRSIRPGSPRLSPRTHRKIPKAWGSEPVHDIAAWFGANRELLDRETGLGVVAGPAIVTALTEMEADKGSVEDLGAINRWPARSGIPLEDYLRLWRASCAQIGVPGHLPARLQDIFALRKAGDP